MTKKDYELIAGTIRDINIRDDCRIEVIVSFEKTLRAIDNKFNRNKFRAIAIKEQ